VKDKREHGSRSDGVELPSMFYFPSFTPYLYPSPCTFHGYLQAGGGAVKENIESMSFVNPLSTFHSRFSELIGYEEEKKL
jgi:hypothetical protein